MDKENKDLAEIPQKSISGSSPAEIAANILKFGGNLEGLEKLMALQERHEANEARKAYHAAMAEFKKNPPEVLKSKKVSYKTSSGQTEYSHADLGEASIAIAEALAKHDLNATWRQKQDTNGITITCTLTHKLGHSESTSLTAPPDNSGGKNTIQAISSTNSYLERYTLFAITGLAPKGIDDDGRGSEAKQPEKKSEKKTITPKTKVGWNHAKAAYKRDGNFKKVLEHAVISEAHQKQIIDELNLEKSEERKNV